MLDGSYYREPAPRQEHESQQGGEGVAGRPSDGASGGGDPGEGGIEPADEPERPASDAGLSQVLVDELAIQRRDILAAHVAADPVLALDLATFLMVNRGSHDFTRTGSSLAASPPSDPIVGFRTPGARATVMSAEAADALDRGWMALDTRAERFDAFRALSDEARAAWLGHAVARSLEASLNVRGQRGCAFHDHLGRVLGIDVPAWWRPTGANFFDRVPKGVTLAALEEIGGPAFAARYAKAKKAELAESAERIFSGEFIGEVEAKQAALAWVPEAMRFAGSPAPAASVDDDTPPWEDRPTGPAAGEGSSHLPADREDDDDEANCPGGAPASTGNGISDGGSADEARERGGSSDEALSTADGEVGEAA